MRFAAALLAVLLMAGLLSGCGKHEWDPLEGVETQVFTDSCGRAVTIPAELTRIAASGSTAQMILMTIAPDMLVGLASSPSRAQRPYFPEDMWYLPTFGQFYGSKASLNMEALIDAQPQIILDLGDRKATHALDMNTIQRQTGIPTVFIEADIDDLPAAYRTLGALLGREEKGEALASFVERTVAMARENAKLAGVERLIHLQRRDVADLSHPGSYGFIITNPPYGERLEYKREGFRSSGCPDHDRRGKRHRHGGDYQSGRRHSREP